MKNFILLFILATLTITVKAQSPQAINYQAVARDNSGNPLTNRNIGVRVGILSGSSTGTSVYSETHNVTTNQFGLFNIEIGRGVVQSGVFAQINWGSNTHFAKIDIDQNGGTNYQFVGTSQMLSVPYALYAENISMQFKAFINGYTTNTFGYPKEDTVEVFQGDTINRNTAYAYYNAQLKYGVYYMAGEPEDISINLLGLPTGLTPNQPLNRTYSSNDFDYNNETQESNPEIYVSSTATPGYYNLEVIASNNRGRQSKRKIVLGVLQCLTQNENTTNGNYKGSWRYLNAFYSFNDTLLLTNPIINDNKITITSTTITPFVFQSNINGNNITIPTTTVTSANIGAITINNAIFTGTGSFDCSGKVLNILLNFTSGTYNIAGTSGNLAGTNLAGQFRR